MTKDNPPGEPRSAATKVLDVLAALSERPGPQQLRDIADHTGLAKATAYRMLQSLVDAGFVVALPGGAYAVGPMFLGVAAAALADSPWQTVVGATLEHLRRATGLSAHFAQSYGDRVVIVQSAESTDAYGLPARPGRASALDDNSFGAAIASASVSAGDDTDRPGVRSVAAPLVDANGAVIGAIGISGTTFTLGDTAAERFRGLVADAAAEAATVLRAQAGSAPRATAGGAGVAS